MSNSLNNCTFIGNVVKDAETKYTSKGTAVTNFTVACTTKSKDFEHTEWVRCTLWGREGIAKYLTKGIKVYVNGELRTRSWEDKEGNKRYSTEVHIGINPGIVLMAKNQSDDTPEQGPQVDPGDMPF